MSEYPAYEAHGHRDNGEVFDVAVLGRLPDTDAFALAEKYANRWRASVSLCRVPFVDPGHLVGWFVDEVEIIAQLVPVIERRA